jgi:mono/diheme cytochrome c family protein
MVSCAAVLAVAVTSAAQEKKSVKTGVYTVAQADRGQSLYRSKCASCHAPNRFTDDLFYTTFAGKPLWDMFDVISDSMPEDNPGSLKKEEYADVIAYLLKLNNFPTGATELPVDKDALSAIVRKTIAMAALHSPNTAAPTAPHSKLRTAAAGIAANANRASNTTATV